MAQRESVGRPTEPRKPALDADTAARSNESEPAVVMSYCPRCSTRLTARSCKMICPTCGYYMSCSDFY